MTVTTLSVQGCCVKGSGLPAAGQDCQLTISWQGREIRVNAKVAWKQPQGQVGLRFLSLDQESTDNLRGLCSTLKLQPLARMTYDE